MFDLVDDREGTCLFVVVINACVFGLVWCCRFYSSQIEKTSLYPHRRNFIPNLSSNKNPLGNIINSRKNLIKSEPSKLIDIKDILKILNLLFFRIYGICEKTQTNLSCIFFNQTELLLGQLNYFNLGMSSYVAFNKLSSKMWFGNVRPLFYKLFYF